MRVENSIKNSLFAISLQIITIISGFVVRTIFIKMLGTEYLGINGLFSNLLQMLSLAEMGVGTAIVYSMYKPMAEDDKKKLRLLINLYAKLYSYIGIIVITIGLLLIPFLDNFTSDASNIPHLRLYFIIYVLNSASSYFFVYKASIITAAQKNYIISANRMKFILLMYIFQILVLLFYKSYVLFLLVSLVVNIIININISLKANRMFPFIKQKTNSVLPKKEINLIFKNIGALFFHRMGTVVVNGTDSLVISKFVGINMVGLFSNYVLIIEAINTIITLIYNALTASVGNLNVTESKEKTYTIYKNILFSNFWIGGVSSISLIILLNPFISLWIGKDFTFKLSVVILIVINSYMTIIRKTTLVFRDAMGLFWKDRYKPIFESIINLVVSIILAQRIGLAGVFIGTLVSTLSTCFWIEPLVLFRYGFEVRLREYFKSFFVYLLVTLGGAILTWSLANTFNSTNLITFIYKLIICLIVPNVVFLIAYYKRPEFIYLKVLLYGVLKRINLTFKN
ncbi:hypothetical protein AN960_00260 [Bacillus sp. FJAT-25509]|uniref:lipopolysaccharide biosynthesis protein n=1 Tax=Bacillus sp. FJAT-25509 TaxID=1712029 RepID=UPI0006F6CA02|nr:oligosaccharide flippase family protein [Bacillus sp. FJAT-25509]KQL42434.1 hypothetical protein AN960_00260 [Bacillus sp. FJAT-25509]